MFSIIIINYRTPTLVVNCLDSLFKFCSTENFEIIVVDNNSQDNSLALLEKKFGAKIKLIANQKNKGFAAANNLGARAARGEYLFFLNSDTFVRENILTPLRLELESKATIGIIAPQLILENNQSQPYAFGLKKDSNPELAWVSGAALIIRRTLFQALQGWDERFFMYFEDQDLSRRAIQKGYQLARLVSVSVIHLVNASPLAWWKRKLYYYQAKLLFLLKYGF